MRNSGRPGEDRCLVLNLYARAHEAALVKGRPGQDEFNSSCRPTGASAAIAIRTEAKSRFNHCPTVEESNEQKIQIVGSIDDAVDAIGLAQALLRPLQAHRFFSTTPGSAARR
jgi:hypothetical protein